MDTTMKIDHLSLVYKDGLVFVYEHLDDGSAHCGNPGGFEYLSSYRTKGRRKWLTKCGTSFFRMTTDDEGRLQGGYLVLPIDRHHNLPALFEMEKSDHAAGSWLDE